MADANARFILTAEDRTKAATAAAAGNFKRLEGAARNVRNAIVGIFGVQLSAQGVASIARLADEYTSVNARLKLVTASQEEFNAVSGELFEIAQRTRGALGETVDLYTRLARSTRDLDGVAPRDLLRVTEAINQALIVSGASGEGARAAITQLGQGLASGTLRGEELNSVLEQTPRLAEAIAAGLDIPFGKLRELAAEGKITSAEIIRALLDQADTLEAEFARMPTTIDQALTKVKNGWLAYIGQTDQAFSATQRVSGAFGALGDNLGAVADSAVRIGLIVATVYGVRVVQAVQTWTAAQITALAAQRAATAAAIADAAIKARQADAVRLHAGMLVAEANAAIASATGMARLQIAQTVLLPARARLAAATAAHTAALGAEAAAAGVTRARLFSLTNAINLVGAAFVGWQIGTFLTDRFPALQRVGIAVMGTLHTAAVRTGAAFEGMGIRFRRAAAALTFADTAGFDDELQDLAARTDQTVADVRDNYQALFDATRERNANQAAANHELTANEVQHRKLVVQVQEQLTKELTDEFAKQLEAREAAKDRLKRINGETAGIEEEFADLVERARKGPQANRAPSFGDAFAGVGQARRLQQAASAAAGKDDFVAAGRDADRALKTARDVSQVVDDLIRSGKGGSGALFLARQLQQIANAAQAVRVEAGGQDLAAQDARLDTLASKIETIKEAAKAVKLQFDADAAAASLEAIRAQLQEYATAHPVVVKVQVETPSTDAADILKTAKVQVPGKAHGGYIPGRSPHPRADNILIRATAGEYMLPVGAVQRLTAAHGAGVLEQLRRGQLPGYADGGPVARQLLAGLDSGARPNLLAMAGNPTLPAAPTTTINLTLPGGQTYTVRADDDTAKTLQRDIRLLAIKSGKR